MKNNLFLFSNTFPYGKAETFLETEIQYLTKKFNHIYIIPLYKEPYQRELPPNASVLTPLLKFNPKERLKLLFYGIFNFSPLYFAFKEFVTEKPYKSFNKTWSFFTFLLIYRSTYKSLKITSNKDDIIYFYWGDKSVVLAPFISQKYSKKIVVRFHNSDLYEGVAFEYIPFRKFIFPAISCFVPISDHGKDYLYSKYPQLIDEHKVIVSRLGVVDNGVNNISNADSSIFHLVSCSNIKEIKRIDLIIRALQKIEFSVHWTHFGSGHLMNKMQELAQNLPNNIQVTWKGHQPNQEVIKFYQTHHVDLFINVSTSEGIPVSIMEALSFGIPTLATNVGGVSEIINEKNGILLSVNIDEAILSSKINEFALSDNTKKRKYARQYWLDNYSADKNYNEFVNLVSLC